MLTLRIYMVIHSVALLIPGLVLAGHGFRSSAAGRRLQQSSLDAYSLDALQQVGALNSLKALALALLPCTRPTAGFHITDHVRGCRNGQSSVLQLGVATAKQTESLSPNVAFALPHSPTSVRCLSPSSFNIQRARTPMSIATLQVSGPRFILKSAAEVVPHPEKANRRYDLAPRCGGEDAYFIDDARGALGIADGVGGWSAQGVDPGIFSRQLMKFAAEAVQEGIAEPLDILQYAHARTTEMGSSTAVIMSLLSESTASGASIKIKVANLGDSGFILVRGKDVLFQSEPMQHSFNHPYQLAPPEFAAGGDDPMDSHEITLDDIKEGDLLILGTDGLFDNVFAHEIAEIVGRTRRGPGVQTRAKAVAQELARTTYEFSLDNQRHSPFAEEARKEGYLHRGGKSDDITVVVAEVVKRR